MEKRWAVGNGNWNTAATWNDPGGGATVPSPGDICHANGYTVTIDVDLTGTPYELRTKADGAPPAAGGKFTTSGTRTIYANVEAGTTTCYDPASASTLYGTAKGGASANAFGAFLDVLGQVHNGNSYGGSAGQAHGTVCDRGAVQTGNSFGGSFDGALGSLIRYGASQSGNSSPGNTSGAHGTRCERGGIQIGDSTGGNTNGAYATSAVEGGIHYGTATGGTTSGAHGTVCTLNGKAFLALATGTIPGAFGVQSSVAAGNCVIVKATSGSYATDFGAGTDTGLTNHPFVNVLAVYPTAAQVLTTIQFGNSGADYTGTLTVPAVGDVQDGVAYGAGGTEYEGTLALPTEAQVEDGVGFGAGGTEFEGEFVGGAGGGPLVGASALISG
jgi:hypothetical protein